VRCDEHATPCDRYAPVVDAAYEVRGGVLATCLVWEVVACVEDIEHSEPVDMGPRGRMAREGSHAMILPKRNNATPSTGATPWVMRRDGEHGIYACGIQINRM